VSYVYILQSKAGDRFYVGMTRDVAARLALHNAGKVRHTAKYRPWRLRTYVAFSDDARASDFERYLKSGSGRAFAARRF